MQQQFQFRATPLRGWTVVLIAIMVAALVLALALLLSGLFLVLLPVALVAGLLRRWFGRAGPPSAPGGGVIIETDYIRREERVSDRPGSRGPDALP